jgi:hypothetical protein
VISLSGDIAKAIPLEGMDVALSAGSKLKQHQKIRGRRAASRKTKSRVYEAPSRPRDIDL